MKWTVVEGPDPEAEKYERLFEFMARADRMSRNECPCGCRALLGKCARTEADQ